MMSILSLNMAVNNKDSHSFSFGNRGFTLIEILVSLAILGTAFAAVLQLHSDSLEMITRGRLSTKAAELAQYKMTEVEINGFDNLLSQSGDFGEKAPDYYWRVDIEPAPVPDWDKITVTTGHIKVGEGGNYKLIQYVSSNRDDSDSIRKQLGG